MADDYAYPPSIRGKSANYFSVITYTKVNGETRHEIQTIDIPQGSDAYAVIEGRKIILSERDQYSDPKLFEYEKFE